MKFTTKKLLVLVVAVALFISAFAYLVWDSDGDGLWDVHENSIGTDPKKADTDDDGLDDFEEVNGAEDGYVTDPLKQDSDSDGLSDYEESFESGSNPRLVDTDDDGALDSIDSEPNGYPEIDWRKEFEPGLIRFSMDFEVYSLRGLYAQKWVYLWPFGPCVFLNDDTEGATRSSEVNSASVIESVSDSLERANWGAFKAVDARYSGYEGSQYVLYDTEKCDHFTPRYKIGYAIKNEIYSVSVMNVQQTEMVDSQGRRYWYSHDRIPIELDSNQTVSLQFHLSEPQNGVGPLSSRWGQIPGFFFQLYDTEAFVQKEPLLQSVVPGTHLGDEVYQVDLQIGKDIATHGNVFFDRGSPAVVLLAMPVWIGTDVGRISGALEPDSFNMVASNHRYVSLASSIVVRQGLDVGVVNEVIPNDISSYSPGIYRFGTFTVCVTRSLSYNLCSSPNSQDAVVILSNSMEQMELIKADVDWGEPGIWYVEQEDELGNVLRTFNDLLDVLEIDRKLYDLWVEGKTSSSSERIRLTETALTLVYVRVGHEGDKRYNVYEGKFQKETQVENGVRAKMVLIHCRIRSTEIVRSPETSGLSKKLGTHLTQSLKVAKIGTVLVSNGREAWLAHLEGDEIRGSLYVAKGGVGAFSVLAEDRTLGSMGVGIRILERVPAAKLAKFVLGILSNGYAMSKIASGSDEFERRVLISQAYTGTFDFMLSVVLGLGVIYLGWSIGVAIAYAIAPNDLAAEVMSSPVSLLEFVIISYFTGEIPSQVARDALDSAVERAILAAQDANNSGRLAIAIIP